MKRKLLTSGIITLLFTIVLTAQVSHVQAQVVGNGPLTSPITFVHTISGKITYRFLGTASAALQPVANVTVQIINAFTHASFSATSDGNGNYSVSVPDGFYQLQSANASNSAFMVPPVRFYNVRRNVTNADFQGLVFPTFTFPSF